MMISSCTCLYTHWIKSRLNIWLSQLYLPNRACKICASKPTTPPPLPGEGIQTLSREVMQLVGAPMMWQSVSCCNCIITLTKPRCSVSRGM